MSIAFEVQTRDEYGSLNFFDTITEAMRFAESDPNVWKISWFCPPTDEHVRLVRMGESGKHWMWDPLDYEGTYEELDIEQDMIEDQFPDDAGWFARGKMFNYVMVAVLSLCGLYLGWHAFGGPS